MSTEPIVCRVTSWYHKRRIAMLVMVLGFSAYFYYDWKIGYPKQKAEYDRMVARNNAPFGYLPALKFGLTEEAEIINGRLAMVGIIALVTSTAIFNESMLDVVNSWLGGLYTK